MSWTDDYDWQPIASYQGQPLTLFRDAGGRPIFGDGAAGAWRQMIDAEFYNVSGFEPVEWAIVPEERWDDWASG